MAYQRFQPGDHIKVHRGLYTHEGIVSCDGCVIHPTKRRGERPMIRETSLEEFEGGGRAVLETNTPTRFTSAELVARARSHLGKTDYSLFGNNCEHFATLVRTGRKYSPQAQAALVVGSLLTAWSAHTHGWDKTLETGAKLFGVAVLGSALANIR